MEYETEPMTNSHLGRVVFGLLAMSGVVIMGFVAFVIITEAVIPFFTWLFVDHPTFAVALMATIVVAYLIGFADSYYFGDGNE